MTIAPERLALLDTITLEAGGHDPDSRFCIMEAVAYVAGEPWTDSPECVSPVIAAFLRSWNDALGDDDRQMLKPLIPKVIGTRTSKVDEEKRAWLATDWLARECAPAFLRLAGLTKHAEALEGLAALTTTKRAEKAQPTLDAARAAARDAARAATGAAARDAARDAARAATGAAARDAARAATGAAARAATGAATGDAARAAAWAAAWDAARAAAGDAAGAAAWAAAWAAAGAAARAATRDALAPTVSVLQQSALLLVERMISA